MVTGRYEFYKYTGPLDPESNEAKCDNYPQIADPADAKYTPECDPASVYVLGDYIGAQMAGFDVEAALGLIDHVQDADLSEPFTPRTVVVGGNTPYVTEITSGALPTDMMLDSATGILSGTPTAAGQFTFTVTATDADSVQVTKTYTMNVVGALDLCADVVCTPSDACHPAGICDPSTGLCSNPTADDGTPCNDGNACTQSDSCQAGTCSGASPVVCAAADVCHVAGSCDPATGACSNPTAADGAICNDGNACTPTDACQGGTRVGSGVSPTCGASADLTLKLHAPRNAFTGRRAAYHIRARNNGPSTAESVVATLTCTGPGITVARTSTECSTSGGVTTCALGALRARRVEDAEIVLVPDAPGTLTCTATVSSATPDPDTSNQSAVAETRVRNRMGH